ncbi:MAG: TIGR04463 family radical SAM/SPASM RiPP maturase [Ardenticatenaceae bacterium]|nr:TIGR04463 family radical SAM/SPASM RiPP maturase [Ardenticatenaceae bacterium]
MRPFQPSRYTITVPLRHGRALAYNALSGGLALWEAPEKRFYDQIGDGRDLDETDDMVRAFHHGGYIAPAETDELAIIEKEYTAHRYNQETMILTIAPTLACNFGCDYCFQGQDKDPETMSLQVQDAIVELVGRVAPRIKRLHIAWYGGEPLVRLNIIEALSDRIIPQCDRHGIKYDALIVTNGYKLTPAAARSLYIRRVKTVQITLDGAPADHDQRRVLLSGGNTFNKIVDNISAWIDEVPLAVSVRVNIDDRNQNRIHGLIDHLAEIGLAGKRNFKLYFAPVEATTAGCHSITDVTMGKAHYGKLEAELYLHAYEAGLSGLPYPPRFRGTCSAVRPKGFVIVPNGDLHKCWDTVSWPEQRVGTIFNLDALNSDERVLRWLRWTPFKNDTCRNCKILPVCAGSCAYKFIHADHTRGEAAVLPCPSWKYNINEKLALRAIKTGVITAEDYDPAVGGTVSTDLCADVLVDGGQPLPAEMQAVLSQMSAKQTAAANRSGVVHLADIAINAPVSA